jgi:ribonuclease Z
MLAVTILGNNSAIPAYGRHPTSQIITTSDDLLMIDCGEGSQIQILNYRIKRSRINHIFISHLHGDHYFGLIGLLNSFALLSRVQPLHLYGPPSLKEIIDLQFRISGTVLSYELFFHPITEKGILLNSKNYFVECFPVKHRIECWGFLIREKKNPRKLLIAEIKKFNIPHSAFDQIRSGKDYTGTDGKVIQNSFITTENTGPKSYAFCADTIFDESLPAVIQHADLVYHETTYPHVFTEKAAQRFHSTTKQAATIAQQANAKKLLIGHFSAKYEQVDFFEEEAKEIFPCTEIAKEGVTYLV